MKLNEQVVITDPGLASKYSEAQKQINIRQKKIAQLESEIVTYKQQITAVEQAAMQKQQATIQQQAQNNKTNNQQTQNSQSNQQTVQTQPPVVGESKQFFNEIKLFLNEKYEDDEFENEFEDDDLYKDEFGDIDYDEEAEIEEDSFLFYFKINEPISTVCKAYKDFENDRWELTVVEGEPNNALEETTFESDFTKLEIINYLAEIYGDVSEIYEDEFDDKLENDKEFY